MLANHRLYFALSFLFFLFLAVSTGIPGGSKDLRKGVARCGRGFVEIPATATVSAGSGRVLLTETVMLNSLDLNASANSTANPAFQCSAPYASYVIKS
ncbi:hypothetical protein Acr_04g0009210 [Actinidia rufa]|uniref:Uncharacterized protein n=1 Tax=Actinidia rufa TaxID=165716 RepID=A0A7J0EI80_9ERIC|nr:hypothetical protein Acr_04g0009210 [Actinidia rufa]